MSVSTRRVLRWMSAIAFGLACTAVVGVVVVLTVLPRITGGAALTVLTGSMTPEIPVGSVVLLRPVDPQTLEVGDIATYQVSPESRALVTHRVLEIEGSGEETRFTFKGDANRGPDTTPVPAQAIRGEVWFHVPYLGALRDALNGQGGIALLLTILLAGYALTQLSGGLMDRRRRVVRPEKRTLRIGGPMVLVQLRTPAGESAVDLARRWDAALPIDEDEESVTLLISPRVDGINAALELLASQEALRMEVWDANSALVGTTRPVTPSGPEHEGEAVGHALE